MISVAAAELEADICAGALVAVTHASKQSALMPTTSSLLMSSPDNVPSINKRGEKRPGGTSDHRVVSSGRAVIANASSVSDSGTVLGTDHYFRRRGGLFRIHHLADLRPARIAEQFGGSQPQRLFAASSHSKRSQHAGAGYARHAGQ